MAKEGTCKAESCDKPVVGKGYCKRHYKIWRGGGLPKARYKTCGAEACKKKQVAHGRCAEHQKNKPKASEAPPPAAQAS
jgi:hypothetical protein